MRAEEKTYVISVVTSERDRKDGIVVNKEYSKLTVTESELESWSVAGGVSTFLLNKGIVNPSQGELLKTGVVKDVDGKTTNNQEITYTLTTPNDGLVFSGKYAAAKSATVDFPLSRMTLTISVFVDNNHYDTVVGAANGDDIDDRDQVGYKVYLQSSIGSEYHEYPVVTYWTNAGDDVAKLVTNGDYTGLPGWDEVEYDSEYNEYYYHYEIKDGAIYGKYVKSEGSKFAKVTTTGPVDLDGDGKISCDEYYGTTGLEWSDKLNACVVSSTGDAVVTIPNTATR